MADKAWKQMERRVAKLFNTKRTPLSGGNGGISRSDSQHSDFFVECKLTQKSAIYSLFQETRPKAEVEGKIPVLAIQKKNQPGFLVAVHSDDLADFCRIFLDEL